MNKEIKRIILNADDFGLSKGVNNGIFDSIEKGMITSVSVMINRPEALEAKVLFKKYKNISVGLHLDFTTEGIHIYTKALYMQTWSKKRLRDEFYKQVDLFMDMFGELPDHINGHHNIHHLPKFKEIIEEFSKQNGIPVRGVDATFQMGFYGRSYWHWSIQITVTPERLICLLDKLPPGVHEIMCHPAYVDQGLIDDGTKYLEQRENEIKSLTSPEVAEYLAKNKNILLINWKQVELVDYQ